MALDERLRLRLLYLVHCGLVDIRNYSTETYTTVERRKESYDLADMLEVIPTYIMRWQDSYAARIRAMCERHMSKYPNSVYDYVKLLELDPHPSFTTPFPDPPAPP